MTLFSATTKIIDIVFFFAMATSAFDFLFLVSILKSEKCLGYCLWRFSRLT